MIGIDIVDLNLASIQSNWSRRGFLPKLFTLSEQRLIFEHQQPEHMVWLLWTMKEAAYKIYSREYAVNTFAPTKLACNIAYFNQNKVEGTVTLSQLLFYTQSDLKPDFICTVAAKEQRQLNQIQINLSKHPNHTAYQTKRPQSISHHGAYLALAYIE